MMGVACASIERASPVISATDTPLIRSAIPKPAIWDGVATPSMISFMAHSLSSELSESPRMSAAKSAGQVVRASMAGPQGKEGRWRGSAGNGGTFPHQPGQFVRQRDRVDRVADHGVGPGPGGEPAVVGPADDQQYRRAVVDLVLGLAAHAHPAGRLRLPVQHHHVRAARVEQPEQRRLGGDLDDLGVRDVHRGATPDGEPDLGPDIRVVAVHNDLHEKACYRPPAPGGRRVSTDTATDPGVAWRSPTGCRNNCFVTTATVETAPRTPASRPNLVSVGTIIWLSSELMFFAALFAMYFTVRSVTKGAGLEWPGAHLNIALGSTNTTVLLLSSVTCQMGVFAVERGQIRRTRSLLHPMSWGLREWYVLTFLMGLYFDLGQGYEYLSLVREQGLTLSSSAYGSVFYIPTGFHGLRVAGGLVAFLFW